MHTILRLIETTEGEEFGPIPNAMLARYQFRVSTRAVKNAMVEAMDRIGKYVQMQDTTIELVEVAPQPPAATEDHSLALYTHPNG